MPCSFLQNTIYFLKILILLIGIMLFVSCATSSREFEASWSEQVKVAMGALGEKSDEYQVFFVNARPLGEITSQNFSAEGIKTTLVVIGAQQETSRSVNQIEYSSKDITYVDGGKNKDIIVTDSGFITSDQSSADLQSAFDQVVVGPREILSKVLLEGIQHVGGPLNSTNTSIHLDISDDIASQYNTVAVWSLIFRGEKELVYLFDATTGEVISKYMQ